MGYSRVELKEIFDKSGDEVERQNAIIVGSSGASDTDGELNSAERQSGEIDCYGCKREERLPIWLGAGASEREGFTIGRVWF
jgi:hypothetical protein